MSGRKLDISELVAGKDDVERFISIVQLARDGENTRAIRRAQFNFAVWVLGLVAFALGAIVVIDVWRVYWGLPGAAPSPPTSPHTESSALLDWAKALINTLFGAALALALGSIYSPPERRAS